MQVSRQLNPGDFLNPASRGNREKVEAERARLILASRDKAVLEQLAASYRAQEKVVTDRRDQREMDDIGARRARLAQTEDQDDGEQGGRS